MINFNIKYLQEADSTNDYLQNLMVDSMPEEGTVILADHQKLGKGQGQNAWSSGKGLNLTFSLMLCPRMHADKFFYLTEIVSLSIIDFLSSYEIEASIKWPNDIYVNNLKIAGILIKNSIRNNEIENCIAGIGINVNEIDFPSGLTNPTSMRIEKQKIFDRNILMDMFLDKMKHRYRQLISGDMELLHIEYSKQIYRKGELIEYKDKNGLFRARLKEINTSGKVMLERENNTDKQYLFGEIEMIHSI